MQRPAPCRSCPLDQTARPGFCPDQIPAGARLLFMGEAPGWHELIQAQPFVGPSGFVLRHWFATASPRLQLALERHEVGWANMLRCLPPERRGRAYPLGAERTAAERQCRSYDSWPDSIETVILCGEVPQRYFFGDRLAAEDAADRARHHDRKGVLGRIGRVERTGWCPSCLQRADGTCPTCGASVRLRSWVFAPHPAWVLRQPRLVQHAQQAIRIACEPLLVVEPVYHYWTPDLFDPTTFRGTLVGVDTEWTEQGPDVLGLAWWEGATVVCTAAPATAWTWYRAVLQEAASVVGQNYWADLHELRRLDPDLDWLEAKVTDVRIEAHAVAGHLAGTGSYDLRTLAFLFGEHGGVRFPLDWKAYETDRYRTCAEDAAAALWVHRSLSTALTTHRLQAVVSIEHRAARVFWRMSEQGLRVDPAVLETIHRTRQQHVADAVNTYGLYEDRGVRVIKRVPIWRSAKILDRFEQQWGIRPPDRTYRTWMRLAHDPHVPDEARQLARVLATLSRGSNDAAWIGSAQDSPDGVTFGKVDAQGRIYPRYDVCGSPDRAVSSGPNAANFPRPGDDPRPIPLRRAIRPLADDHVLVSVDFSSLETITTAIEAGDWQRAEDARLKRISHEGTAALINDRFGLTLTRQQGKAINHGFDKGESPYNLARTLFQVERPARRLVEQCRAIMQEMLQQYPQTARFRAQLWHRALANPLVVVNRFGRRLCCFSRAKYGETDGHRRTHRPDLLYWCGCETCAARRDRWKTAIAFLGRSTGYDALIRVMCRIWEERLLGPYSLPVAEVHDELVFSVPAADAPMWAARALAAFQTPIPELDGIVLPADAHWGPTWADCK